jgi:hypothetical protein
MFDMVPPLPELELSLLLRICRGRGGCVQGIPLRLLALALVPHLATTNGSQSQPLPILPILLRRSFIAHQHPQDVHDRAADTRLTSRSLEKFSAPLAMRVTWMQILAPVFSEMGIYKLPPVPP